MYFLNIYSTDKMLISCFYDLKNKTRLQENMFWGNLVNFSYNI